MKFSAVLQDIAAIDAFIRLLNATCRLGKKRCCIKIQNDGLCFISCSNIHDGGSWFCIFLPCSSNLFRKFDFIGLNPRSPDQNFIYLEVDADNLVRILPGGHCYLKIKLSNGPAKDPVLNIDVRNPDSDIVSHQVPITVVYSKNWNNYARPTIGQKKMSIYMPPPRIIWRIIQAYKNMNAKVVKFVVGSNGDMRLSSTFEHGEIDSLFSDLPTNLIDSDTQEETVSVQLMLKSITTMFQSFTFSKSRIKMNIISNRMAEFTMVSEDCNLSYIVGNISDQ